MAGELLRQEDRPVLPAGAAERHREAREIPVDVGLDVRVHDSPHVFPELLHVGRALEPVRDGLVGTRHVPQLGNVVRVRERAAVEHEPPAVSLQVGGIAVPEREALDQDTERAVRRRAKLGAGPAVGDASEHLLELGQRDREPGREQTLEVARRVGHALEEAPLPLEEAAVAVRSHGLHEPHEHEAREQLAEPVPIHRRVPAELVEIVLQQLGAQRRWDVCLRVVQQRGDVVVRRAPAATLEVEEPGLAVPDHDIA
jgi:hypothetical protein